MKHLILLSIFFLFSCGLVISQENPSFPNDEFLPWEGGPAYYGQWVNGPSASSSYFPIGVWLQSPANSTSSTYKSMGINTYIGLWNGPTESQLSAVAKIPMTTFCDQNPLALNSANKGVIKAWIQTDEPDNAVSGTEVPIPTDTIIKRYNEIKANDGSRPVFIGLGQGIASDYWYGRGTRTNHREDYIEYAKGGDILCFDVYPMNVFLPNSTDPDWMKKFHNEVAQEPWFVAQGVDRLRFACNYEKPVWTWIETTNINGDPNYKLTPSIVKAEIWMALIHGSRGIGYFCHQLVPFIEAGVLANSAMRDGLSGVNAQISSLAPVLNTQSVANGLVVSSSNSAVSIDAMLKRLDGCTYIFAVSMRPGTTTAIFSPTGTDDGSIVEVVGENRYLRLSFGTFQDDFTDFQVHIYKISPATGLNENEVPADFNLFQDFQGINHQPVSINYQIPENGFVQISVFDLLGKKIASLVNEEKQAQKYQVQLDKGNLQSGIYLCKLQLTSYKSGNVFSANQKVMIY